MERRGDWIAAAHEVAPLSSDALDVDILFGLGLDELRDNLQNVRVECARQPLVTRHNDQQNVLLRALGEQRMARLSGDGIVDVGSGYERFQNVRQHLRIGTGRERAFLRAA